MSLWCHGLCQLSISQYSERSFCFPFKPMDDLISFLRTDYRLNDKGLSIKTVWQKLIQNWAFFGLIYNNIDQDSEEIHPSKLQIFLRIFHREQDYSCVKKLEAALQIKQTNNRQLKLVEVCSLKFLLVLIRDISFNIHVEIFTWDCGKSYIFDRLLPSKRCLLDISPEWDIIK